ncbi:MAG TPA: peptide deformylase [Candidatus Stackebrandtia faecavium]|nr:peptide deformylase [Candidatus Stackebrandtia faecavium]
MKGEPLRITEHGEKILHEPCQAVTDFGALRWAKLINDMFTTMWIANGCGLAANQVDVDARLFVYDVTDEQGNRHVGHVFNPTIEVTDKTPLDEEPEGCLSVPGANQPLSRPSGVRLTGMSRTGEPLTLNASGFLARCFQHETDHLNGGVYVDLLNKRARRRALAESAREREETLAARAEASTQLGKTPAAYPETAP